MRDRNVVDPEGRKGREELGGIEGEPSSGYIIRKYVLPEDVYSSATIQSGSQM